MTKQDFYRQVKSLIEKHGIKKVAREFDISHPSVRRWFNGESCPATSLRQVVIDTLKKL